MKLSPPARRLMLTTHVLVSVGWFGAVIAFLAVAVAGLSSADDRTVEGAYLAGAVMTWWVIVPLGLASLGTGLIQSWGTPWGLFKHYWVVAKLLLTVLATGVLLLHTGPIGALAAAAADHLVATPQYQQMRLQMVVASAAAAVLLAVTTVLAIYKPRGTLRQQAAGAVPGR